MANTQFNVDSLTSLKAFLDYVFCTVDDAARREALCKLDMGRVMEEMIALEAERRRVEEGVRRQILLGREFVAERRRQMGGIMMCSEQMYSLEENDGGQLEEQCHPLARRPSEARPSLKQSTTTSLLKKTSTEALEPSPPSVVEGLEPLSPEASQKVSSLKRKATELSNSSSVNLENSSIGKEPTLGQSSGSPGQFSAANNIQLDCDLIEAKELQETGNSSTKADKPVLKQPISQPKTEVRRKGLNEADTNPKQHILECAQGLNKDDKAIPEQPNLEQESEVGVQGLNKAIPKEPVLEQKSAVGMQGLTEADNPIPIQSFLEQKSDVALQKLQEAERAIPIQPILEKNSEVGVQGLKKKKKQQYFCKVCEVPCTSFKVYEGHLVGKKHKDMLSKLAKTASLVANHGNSDNPEHERDGDEGKSRGKKARLQ